MTRSGRRTSTPRAPCPCDGIRARCRSTQTHYNLRFGNRAGKSLQDLCDPLLLAVLTRYTVEGNLAEVQR